MAKNIFEADCTAPACEERFSEYDPDVLDEKLDRHYTRYHPERYHSKMDLPMVRISRISDEMMAKRFPKAYSAAFKRSMK